MTLHVADIARWQGNLTLEQVYAAGFRTVNVKTSHGMGDTNVHADAKAWIAGARQRGMGVSTFHWLAPRPSGAEQASYAFTRLAELSATAGPFAHVVDVEMEGITEAIWRDYVLTMATLLGRPVITYTGDWWWRARAVGWRPLPESPWLWAAPNTGYLGSYPGDDSPHWEAGYGGWDHLAAMQYAVAPVAGIKVSMTAIRSMDLWATMTGDVMVIAPWTLVPSCRHAMREFDETFPDRDHASDGAYGNEAHAGSPSGHNPDESGNPEDHDADDNNEVRAIDVDADLRMPGVTMEDCIQLILAGCRSGRITWIKYIIFKGRIWRASNGWVQETYRGANKHDKHAHFSSKPDTASENNVRPLGLRELVDMDLTAANLAAIKDALLDGLEDDRGKKALATGVFRTDGVLPAPGRPAPGTNPDGTQVNTHWAGESYLTNTYTAAVNARDSSAAAKALGQSAVTMIQALGRTEAVDVGALATELAPILASAVIAGLPDDRDDLTPDELKGAFIDALKDLANRE